MKRTLLLILGAGLCVTSLACNNNPRPLVKGRLDLSVPDQIDLAQPRLANEIVFSPVNATRDRADLLYVEVPVRSDVNQTIYIDYRFRYFDRNGQVLYNGGVWMPKTLQSNTPDVISGNSLDNRAVDVRVDVRYAK